MNSRAMTHRYTRPSHAPGFRYTEITGLDSLQPSDISAVVIGADITQSSDLRMNNTLLQKIQVYAFIAYGIAEINHKKDTTSRMLHQSQDATVWSQRANTQDILTDCPQRDERLGWMGDAALSCEEVWYGAPMCYVWLKCVCVCVCV